MIINKQNVKVELDSEFEKAINFVKEKLKFDPTTLDFTWNVEERELKTGEKMAFVLNNFHIPFIVSAAYKATGLLWVVIAHEIYHVIAKKITATGKAFIQDEMDYTFVNGVGIPYYKNWDPYASDGNFAVMTKKMLPYIHLLQKVEATSYGASFMKAVTNTLNHEGGYINDPNDPGGETNFGISKKAYPNVNIKALTREEAVKIYHRDYWKPIKGDSMPYHLACNVFDMAVNAGVKTAVKMMQTALGVVSDGAIGPKTLKAMETASLTRTEAFIVGRIQYYVSLSQYSLYGKGWLKRVVATFSESLK